jgi:hypothetical protein
MRAEGIAQPVNALSSLAFLIIAGIVVVRGRRFLSLVDASLLALGLAVTGLGSFWYHAEFSFASQIADIAGMYLIATFMLIRRWLPAETHPASCRLGAFLAMNAVLLAIQVGLPIVRRVVFAVLVIAAFVGEWRARREGRRLLAASVATLGVAAVVWFLDWSRVMCDPSSFLQGHAVWHVLGAVSAALLVHYYEIQHARA